MFMLLKTTFRSYHEIVRSRRISVRFSPLGQDFVNDGIDRFYKSAPQLYIGIRTVQAIMSLVTFRVCKLLLVGSRAFEASAFLSTV